MKFSNQELVFKYSTLEAAHLVLLTANKELAFQISEKEMREAELFVANKRPDSPVALIDYLNFT